MQNQKKLWDNIAKEWHEFRTEKQGQHALDFLKGKTGKILDLGSGSGRYLMNIKNGKMFLVDFSEEMIKLAKQKAKKENLEADFKVADMTNLPYENDFFDYAICSSAFHCIKKENQKKAVQELHRVLKKGGQVEISVWKKDSKRFKNADKEKLVGWRDLGKRYYYLFDKNEIYKLFKDTGFKIVSKEEPRKMIVFVVEKV
jgi:ubiquinone/menaquinone biosynthesis C-methylase UbiE